MLSAFWPVLGVRRRRARAAAARASGRCARRSRSTRSAAPRRTCSRRPWAATPRASGALCAGPLAALVLWRRRTLLLALLALPLCGGSGAPRWTTSTRRVATRRCTPPTTRRCSRSSTARRARATRPGRDPLHATPLGGALGRAARRAGARLGAPARPQGQRALLRRAPYRSRRRATATGSIAWRSAGSRCRTRGSTTPRSRGAADRARAAVPAGGLEQRRLAGLRGARPGAARLGPARVTGLDADTISLDARRSATLRLRVRWTPYWAVAAGDACVDAGRRLDEPARATSRRGAARRALLARADRRAQPTLQR